MIERYQQKYHALGSETVLTLVSDRSPSEIDQVFARLHQHITSFEARFSRFKDDSELTLFNRRAGEKVAVSEAFRRLLATAKDMSEQTGGLYNPFVLPALQKAGYLGSWPSPGVGSVATDFSAHQVVPSSHITVGDSWASLPKNSALDFGGIGKGYLLDQLAAVLRAESLTGYWLSLGGDIMCAGYDLQHRPWHVAIQDVHDVNNAVDTISNTGGDTLAIATSGIIKRKGRHNGVAWHHIIDPRISLPADTDILSVTVSARTAVIADVIAKCIVIAGEDRAIAYQKQKLIASYYIQKNSEEKP